MNDTTFLYFKPNGKWKYEGRGRFPLCLAVNHTTIREANDGMPGITGDALGYTIVVIPDEDCTAKYAYPRMIQAHEDPESHWGQGHYCG